MWLARTAAGVAHVPGGPQTFLCIRAYVRPTGVVPLAAAASAPPAEALRGCFDPQRKSELCAHLACV